MSSALGKAAATAAAAVPYRSVPARRATLPSVSFDAGSDDDVDDLAIPELQPSSTTSEMQRPFDLLDEAEVEHASAKDLIAQIEAGSPGDPLFDAKVKVLGEYIDHHVKEEEREMFPQAKKADLDLRALGEQMAMRKRELEREMKSRVQ